MEINERVHNELSKNETHTRTHTNTGVISRRGWNVNLTHRLVIIVFVAMNAEQLGLSWLGLQISLLGNNKLYSRIGANQISHRRSFGKLFVGFA